jgi:hypothetical protein
MRKTCYGVPLTGQHIPGLPWRTPGSVARARAAVEPSTLKPTSSAATVKMNRRVVQALG